MAAQKVPVHKARKRQREKQRTGDGVELPPLGSILASTTLQQHRKAAHQKVLDDQFHQTDEQSFARRSHRPHQRHPVVEERQIGRHQSSQNHQPNGTGL